MDWIRNVEWPMWFGYAAVLASVVTCAMKTMIPLRIVSMVCNSLFIIYGIFGHIYPTLILNCILLPLNGLPDRTEVPVPQDGGAPGGPRRR